MRRATADLWALSSAFLRVSASTTQHSWLRELRSAWGAPVGRFLAVGLLVAAPGLAGDGTAGGQAVGLRQLAQELSLLRCSKCGLHVVLGLVLDRSEQRFLSPTLGVVQQGRSPLLGSAERWRRRHGPP